VTRDPEWQALFEGGSIPTPPSKENILKILDISRGDENVDHPSATIYPEPALSPLLNDEESCVMVEGGSSPSPFRPERVSTPLPHLDLSLTRYLDGLLSPENTQFTDFSVFLENTAFMENILETLEQPSDNEQGSRPNNSFDRSADVFPQYNRWECIPPEQWCLYGVKLQRD